MARYTVVAWGNEQGYNGSIGTDNIDIDYLVETMTNHIGEFPDHILILENGQDSDGPMVIDHFMPDREFYQL